MNHNEVGDSWTVPVPATRHTARYGLRRPLHNSYASVIYSQKPVLPTDPTRVTTRGLCKRGTCNQSQVSNDILETKESLCGDCYQPVRGPGQPAWVQSYDDSLQKLMVDSELRDKLIRQAYRDIANQSNQIPSKPVLCKALARLYDHGPSNPLKRPPTMDDEDYRVQRWYEKNCYPYVTASGSISFYEKPLPRKEWVDNVVRQLGPALNYMESCTRRLTACPCRESCGERAVMPRPPVVTEEPQIRQKDQQWYKEMYGLHSAQNKELILQQQRELVQTQKNLRDKANPDFDDRIDEARFSQHQRQQIANAQRVQSIYASSS